MLGRDTRGDRVGDLDAQPRVDDVAKLEVGEAPLVAPAAALFIRPDSIGSAPDPM